MVLKKWCSCKGRGNRPPTDPLFASTFTSLLPEILCLSLPHFYVLKCFFFPVLCAWLKSTYSCFWFKVENVAISSCWANQILFQSLLLLNEVLQTVNGPGTLFYSFWGRGVSCSMEEWRMRAILEGVCMCGIEWAVNFCQAVRCVWQWVYGRETGGVGARQGLTWSKTQMQSHIGKVREREKEPCRAPLIPPLPLPIFP